MIEMGHMLLDLSNLPHRRRLLRALDPTGNGSASLPTGAPANVTERMAAAVEWYKRAADAGSVEGLFYFAWANHYGVGVDANATLARELYLR